MKHSVFLIFFLKITSSVFSNHLKNHRRDLQSKNVSTRKILMCGYENLCPTIVCSIKSQLQLHVTKLRLRFLGMILEHSTMANFFCLESITRKMGSALLNTLRK